MERFKAWVKEHPKLAAALGIAVLAFLWLVSRRGSSGGGTSAGTSTDQLNAQELQYAAQQQAQETALTEQTNQLDAQLAALSIQSGSSLDLARISADVQNRQTDAGVAVAQLQAQVTEQANVLGSNVQLQTIQSQTAIEQQLIGAITGTPPAGGGGSTGTGGGGGGTPAATTTACADCGSPGPLVVVSSSGPTTTACADCGSPGPLVPVSSGGSSVTTCADCGSPGPLVPVSSGPLAPTTAAGPTSPVVTRSPIQRPLSAGVRNDGSRSSLQLV